MSQLKPVILVVAVLFVAGCIPPSAVVAPATLTPATNLPNPASAFCEEQGYRLVIRSDETGAQAGVCQFPDGSECDEWAYYRGECTPGEPPATASGTPDSDAADSGAADPGAADSGTTASPTRATEATLYTSPTLGISFSYLPEQNGQTVKVREQGDKVYVYPATMEATAGQWVQVFTKAADESLVDAISRVIMPGYPTEDCQVVTLADPAGTANQTANNEYAGIVVRRAEGEDDETVLSRWKTCPQPYTVVGGIGYFQADKLHPTRFLFLSIGQYGILGGDNLRWQETIRFDP